MMTLHDGWKICSLTTTIWLLFRFHCILNLQRKPYFRFVALNLIDSHDDTGNESHNLCGYWNKALFTVTHCPEWMLVMVTSLFLFITNTNLLFSNPLKIRTILLCWILFLSSRFCLETNNHIQLHWSTLLRRFEGYFFFVKLK